MISSTDMTSNRPHLAGTIIVSNIVDIYTYIYIYIYISEENKFGVILLPIIEKQAVIDNTGEIHYYF